MARIETSDCIGCDTCIHCGRGKKYTVYECDACGADSSDTRIFEYEPYHYCLACLLKANMSDFIRDMIDDHGEEWVSENYIEVGE